jgi:hypothetical protein
VIEPATSERNFTPTSMAAESLAEATAGVTTSDQMLVPAATAAVVNDQVEGAARRLPAMSVPPLTVAV